MEFLSDGKIRSLLIILSSINILWPIVSIFGNVDLPFISYLLEKADTTIAFGVKFFFALALLGFIFALSIHIIPI